MIDFTESEYLKMRKIDPASVMKDIQPLLIDGEEIVGAYKTVRDYCVFTSKRVIAVNTQGVTGKKKAFSSLPYSKVNAFCIETSGVFDIDSELEMYFGALGKVRFEFIGTNNIIQIGKIIASYTL